jgi:hypothetical protein
MFSFDLDYTPHSSSTNTDTKATSFLLSKSFFYYERLKGVWQEIFSLKFFHESVSPGLMSIPLGSFQLFSEIFANECLSAVSTQL